MDKITRFSFVRDAGHVEAEPIASEIRRDWDIYLSGLHESLHEAYNERVRPGIDEVLAKSGKDTP